MNGNRRGEPRHGPSGNAEASAKADAEKILSGDYAAINAIAERLAKQLENVRRAQIRKVYSEILQYDQKDADRRRLVLVKARLVYAAARQKRDYAPLRETFSALLDRAAEDDVAFQYTKDFAEALVAYHTLYAKEDRGDER